MVVVVVVVEVELGVFLLVSTLSSLLATTVSCMFAGVALARRLKPVHGVYRKQLCPRDDWRIALTKIPLKTGILADVVGWPRPSFAKLSVEAVVPGWRPPSRNVTR